VACAVGVAEGTPVAIGSLATKVVPADKDAMVAAAGLRMEAAVEVGSVAVVELEWDIVAADTVAETWTTPVMLRSPGEL
jgi:hypothetical protein